jgi:hypothetical protein
MGGMEEAHRATPNFAGSLEPGANDPDDGQEARPLGFV